jgi:hypothetical protein
MGYPRSIRAATVPPGNRDPYGLTLIRSVGFRDRSDRGMNANEAYGYGYGAYQPATVPVNASLPMGWQLPHGLEQYGPPRKVVIMSMEW